MKRPSEIVSINLLSRGSEISRSLRSDFFLVLTPRRRLPHWAGVVLFYAVFAAAVSTFFVWETRGSWVQSRLLSRYVQGINFAVDTGKAPSTRFPAAGPYDERLGYVRLPRFVEILEGKGYEVESQARMSAKMIEAVDAGLFPLYHEKSRAGLSILAEDGSPIYAFRAPERAYASLDSIPPIVLRTLFFIENRDMMDTRYPYRNPAVEWDRLIKGAFDLARSTVADTRPAGGSTLATQMEKYRHSRGGLTTSIDDKVQQVVSASCRSYLDGPVTLESRRRIALDYVNTVPLAAIAGYGEVYGLLDGLWAWYGADPERASRLLGDPDARSERLAERALAYRQVLSLFIAHRRPAYYLVEDPSALAAITDTYLHLLAADGVITPYLRDTALEARSELRRRAPSRTGSLRVRFKAVEGLRVHLLKLLDAERLYDLDRWDLSVESTLDKPVLEKVATNLKNLRDPKFLESAGLVGERLLSRPSAEGVVCSFTLYEHVGDANLLRVQADNFDQPLNINEGTKLELGSTAKLRALVTYLEIVAELHARYAGVRESDLETAHIPPSDNLSQWAVDYLMHEPDTSLSGMLDAAMERPYSANPRVKFFTGGTLHEFSNFDPKDDRRVYSVRAAFHHSVNLVFIRLMRDIVQYYMFSVEGSTARILEDADDPNREVYLTRFADYEGKKFIVRFYRKYKNQEPEDILETLAQRVAPAASRLAMLYRNQNPDSSFADFQRFMRDRLPDERLEKLDLPQYFDQYAPDSYTLADQGYITRVHPLELWTARYLRHHPDALLSAVFEESADERQEVYRWLFKTRRKNAQDARIKTMLEIEAFDEIHASWKRVGYPFDSLVPSYATAIGSSADRPASLAELVGIILNEGMRFPVVRMQRLRFAEQTPYETVLRNTPPAPERVMQPEIARVLREALIGVVENGTAIRAKGAFVGASGAVIPVGGKTGTGDNQYEVFEADAGASPRWVRNRTATFVFAIGERFFGTITVYVPGPESSEFGFTSSLPVQILKVLAPSLVPMIERPLPAASGERQASNSPLDTPSR